MSLEVKVISIGAMAANPLWGEKAGSAVRVGHATTTLVRTGKRTILIDPGLPGPALLAKLSERANISAGDVTHVFLTCFRPDVRRGTLAFPDATWWISEAERESIGVMLVRRAQQAEDEGDADLHDALKQDVEILQRCQPAPDRLADRVDIFPLPGVTAGMCGVLVGGPATGVGPGTTLICGDAAPTLDHIERFIVPHGAANVEAAQESLREAIEIADVIIPGRDNLVLNSAHRTLGGPAASMGGGPRGPSRKA